MADKEILEKLPKWIIVIWDEFKKSENNEASD